MDTGAIGGTVTDQTGAVIPGVKITLINQGTSFQTSTVTDSSGNYVFTPVRIGTYTVTAEYQGFEKATHKDIVVNVQQTDTLNFGLQPGQVTQTVEVTGQAPLLQTSDASVGQVIGERQVNDLPLNGRNFTFLAQLSAGATVGQQEGRGLNATGTFSANGARPAQNNYLLDGIDNNIDLVDFLNGTAFVVLPPVDAIAEFKVQTNNYSAEFGRAGGAVLNATVKSGMNGFHGDAWEFVRNDVFDAADFFENAGGLKKGAYRQNQFGGSIGGPIKKNKVFFFGDYQGTRIRQASTNVVTVPTALERSSGYTDFSELTADQAGCTKGPDLLGRSVTCGTIFDPATTRSVTQGVVDPVTGMVATGTGYVRDLFPGNMVPPGRLDPNAIKLLNLFPAPTATGIFNNFADNPIIKNNANSFDVRVDGNINEKNQMFARFSYLDNPQFKPGPFTGIADGGAFNEGTQTANSTAEALSYTHTFAPTLINEARVGFNRIGTSRLQANGNTTGIPAQFGIQDIPQVPQNGGLPAFGIGSYAQLGSNPFLVSVEYNSTLQVTENITKIRNNHTFKGGFEFQHIKFSTLQPPWSRGQWNYGGVYTSIPNVGDSTTGVAQVLLTPELATVSNGVNYSGGSDSVFASNMANTDDGRDYYGAYFNDDWKVTPKLTLNLGLRWDWFGQVHENFGAQANFVPGTPFSGAEYLIPSQRKKDQLSTSFTSSLASEGINLIYTDNQGLGVSQKTNFAPRFGFAYQATPKFVVRGGYGIFYGGFENRGYSPNIGENYPFQFQFSFFNPDPVHPITNESSGCEQFASFELGFSCIPLTPSEVNASGLALEGIQYHYVTPYTQSANLILQYQLTPNDSAWIGYVGSYARHLEVFTGSNQVSEILPPGTNVRGCTASPPSGPCYIPFPTFGQGQSYASTQGDSFYHALQTNYEHRFHAGLTVLANYTYSKVMSDAKDLLNGNVSGYRGPYLPHFGIQGDYSLADFDVRNVFHLSGIYALPFGKGQRWANQGGAVNAIVGGWTANWILTLQDGQPYGVNCSISTQSGTGCVPLLTGVNPISGQHNVNQWLNPAAFKNPVVATTAGQTDYAPLGGKIPDVVGPGFHRMDFSLFKQIRTSETTHFEFRAEFFNLTNHPNFGLPSDNTFSDTNFGKITSTRDNPSDPRQIQLALKFYF
jgi:hypothetical protein